MHAELPLPGINHGNMCHFGTKHFARTKPFRYQTYYDETWATLAQSTLRKQSRFGTKHTTTEIEPLSHKAIFENEAVSVPNILLRKLCHFGTKQFFENEAVSVPNILRQNLSHSGTKHFARTKPFRYQTYYDETWATLAQSTLRKQSRSGTKHTATEIVPLWYKTPQNPSATKKMSRFAVHTLETVISF